MNQGNAADAASPSGHPGTEERLRFFAPCIGAFDGSPVICLVNGSELHVSTAAMSAKDARTLAADLMRMADVIDPPPKQWQVVDPNSAPEVAKAVLKMVRKRTAARKSTKRKSRRAKKAR